MSKGTHRAPSKEHSNWLIMMVVVGMFVALAAPAGASASKTDVCHYGADSGLYTTH